MDKVLFDQLNSIYFPIWNKANDVKNYLMSAGYEVSLGFFNNHYIKYGNDFVIEYFPIPVITVDKICDIGIDLDTYWIEICLDKNSAALLDYPELAQNYKFEVYGSKDFCYDFYNNHSDPYIVTEKINNSNETLINVTFYLDLDSNIYELVNIIKQFNVLLFNV